MHTSFFSDIIARKPALFRAMLAFNGRLGSVVPDCPEAWRVPGLNTAIVAAELSRRGSPVLAWPVAPPEEGFWDFTDESRRLAFLSAEELERLPKCSPKRNGRNVGMLWAMCWRLMIMNREPSIFIIGDQI